MSAKNPTYLQPVPLNARGIDTSKFSWAVCWRFICVLCCAPLIVFLVYFIRWLVGTPIFGIIRDFDDPFEGQDGFVPTRDLMSE